MRQVTKVRLEPGVERTGARSDSSSVSKACAQHRIGWFKQGSSAKQIFKTLETGVPRSAMVGYKNLSDDERWALASYVLELKAGR